MKEKKKHEMVKSYKMHLKKEYSGKHFNDDKSVMKVV